MMNIDELFSDSYAEAREKFLAAAHAKDLVVDSYELDLKGARDETLALRLMDEHLQHVEAGLTLPPDEST